MFDDDDTFNGGDDNDLVKVQFKSAAPLVKGNQVKIDGVVVGTVETFTVKDGMAEVSLDLDEAAMPLHKDAKMTIRPVSLLGERYIDLERGSADAPVLGKGEVIPATQTNHPSATGPSDPRARPPGLGSASTHFR